MLYGRCLIGEVFCCLDPSLSVVYGVPTRRLNLPTITNPSDITTRRLDIVSTTHSGHVIAKILSRSSHVCSLHSIGHSSDPTRCTNRRASNHRSIQRQREWLLPDVVSELAPLTVEQRPIVLRVLTTNLLRRLNGVLCRELIHTRYEPSAHLKGLSSSITQDVVAVDLLQGWRKPRFHRSARSNVLTLGRVLGHVNESTKLLLIGRVQASDLGLILLDPSTQIHLRRSHRGVQALSEFAKASWVNWWLSQRRRGRLGPKTTNDRRTCVSGDDLLMQARLRVEVDHPLKIWARVHRQVKMLGILRIEEFVRLILEQVQRLLDARADLALLEVDVVLDYVHKTATHQCLPTTYITRSVVRDREVRCDGSWGRNVLRLNQWMEARQSHRRSRRRIGSA